MATNGPAGSAKRGMLAVVGTGISTIGQMTIEAIAWITNADKVLYIVGDPVAETLIQHLNPDGAESLTHFYDVGKPRVATYHEMIERILECVREGNRTCLACYGHPGVFVYPSHEAVRLARAEGYEAKMYPGISSEDCMFADLGFDPGASGCQSFEATDFLVNRRQIDPRCAVVLWQIGVVGDVTFKQGAYDTSAMPLLVEHLQSIYPPMHVVYLYEAPMAVGGQPRIIPVALSWLGAVPMSPGFTLYIPPAYATVSDPMIVQRMEQLRS